MFRSNNLTVGNLIDDLRWPKSLQSASSLMWQSKDKSNYFVVELSSPSISPDSVLSWHFKRHIRGALIIANYSVCVCGGGGGGGMSILGDVSKIYKQYTLVSQNNCAATIVQQLCSGLFRCCGNSHSHSVSLCLYLFCLPPPPPIEVAGVSEAYEDAANCLWLLSNSKPCANCKSPIQKNEGCNHMQCAKVQ